MAPVRTLATPRRKYREWPFFTICIEMPGGPFGTSITWFRARFRFDRVEASAGWEIANADARAKSTKITPVVVFRMLALPTSIMRPRYRIRFGASI